MLIVTYLALKSFVETPAHIFQAIAEKIREMAEEECWGEGKIKQELLQLQMRLEIDEITEDEYMVAEAALMKRLDGSLRRRGGGSEK